MFWKKKKKIEVPKQALVLQAYFAGSTVFMEGRSISPAGKSGLQVFILGMVDMLRQAENLSWEEFLEIYNFILSQHNILPRLPIEKFVDKVESLVSSDENVAKIMRVGAQSITMYMAENDANAPLDLLSVIPFAEDCQSSFDCII
jgi:hypothetical protein